MSIRKKLFHEIERRRRKDTRVGIRGGEGDSETFRKRCSVQREYMYIHRETPFTVKELTNLREEVIHSDATATFAICLEPRRNKARSRCVGQCIFIDWLSVIRPPSDNIAKREDCSRIFFRKPNLIQIENSK